VQLGSAATIVVFDGVMTFAILKAISLVVPLRLPDAVLDVGDTAVHGEEIMMPWPHDAPDRGHPIPRPVFSNPATGGAMFRGDVPPTANQS
jgi:Amt family ammonium transporter